MTNLLFPAAALALLGAVPANGGEIPLRPVHAGHIASAVEELYAADDVRVERARGALAGQDVGTVDIDVCVDPATHGLSAVATVSLTTEAPDVSLGLNDAFTILSVAEPARGPLEFSRDAGVLTIHAGRPLRGPTELRISYAGKLDPGGDVWLGEGFVCLGPGASWYPTPGPGDRARFRVVVRYPDGFTSVGTGALAGMTPSREGVDDTCALGDVWDTRGPVGAAALAVGRFSSSHSVWGDVLLGYHALVQPGEMRVGDEEASVGELKRLVRFLENCYGPYPFEWLNVVSIPGADVCRWSANAPGFAVWDAGWIRGALPSEGREGAPGGLSKSWWPHWVDLPVFLSEGLAAHSEISLLRETGDEEAAIRLREARLGVLAAALADSGGRAGLHGCVGEDGQVDLRVCRAKGGAVLELLERLIGRDAFCGALVDIGERFQGQPAPLREAAGAFEERSNTDLDWFFYEWVYREGLPTYVLDYEISADARGYTVRGAIRQDGEIFRTPVPLTVDFGVWSYEEWIAIESSDQAFEFLTELEPLQVLVDGSRIVPQIGQAELALLHFERGVSASAANDWGTAVDEFGAAAELEPDEALYRQRYGDALVHSGRQVLGLTEIEAAIELAPDDPDMRIFLARLELLAGRYDEALRHLEVYVGLRDADPVGRAQMALALVGLGRLAEAERTLLVADSLAADSTATPASVREEVRLAEGRFHEAAGDTASAVKAYQAALRLNSVSDEARRRLRELSAGGGER